MSRFGGGRTTTRTSRYVANFAPTESPLQGGGPWRANGTDWTQVNCSGGLAFGTQTGAGAVLSDTVNDSNTCLVGFGPNHGGTAVIRRAADIVAPGLQEVEILLRWSTSEHSTRGYECNLAWDGAYAEIVRWNGAYNDYTSLVQTNNPVGSVATGDIFEAQIVGSTISVWLTPVATGVRGLIHSATDSTYSDGNPGIGFYRWDNGGSTSAQSHCFSAFTAVTL